MIIRPLSVGNILLTVALFFISFSVEASHYDNLDCGIAIDSVTTVGESCPGANDGSISVFAGCTDCSGTLEYSLDGAAFGAGTNFTGLAAGAYTVVVRDGRAPSCSDTLVATVAADIQPPMPDGAVVDGWREVAEVLADDPQADTQFSNSVSVWGNVAVVGVGREAGEYDFSGAAYVFERSRSGQWVQIARLQPSDLRQGDYFGHSVSIWEDRIVIGAFLQNSFTDDTGAAYVYERDGAGQWVQVAKLTASNPSRWQRFGASVAIHDNHVIIGCDKAYNTSGYIEEMYAFKRDEAGNWQQTAILQPSDQSGPVKYGRDIALSGEYLVVGASYDDVNHENDGGVYVYRLNSLGNWEQQAKLDASDGRSGHLFGSSVAIWENRIAVGAYRVDNTKTHVGKAYVFEQDGAGNWQEVAGLMAPDNQTYDEFGGSIAIYGNRLLVGAAGVDEAGSNSGTVYSFQRDPQSGWTYQHKVQAVNRRANNGFGGGLSLYKDHLLVKSGAGMAHFLEPKLVLPPLALTTCEGEVPVPMATSECYGTIVGSTTDETSFTNAGNYGIEWTFTDPYGNTSVAQQQVSVKEQWINITDVDVVAESCATAFDGSINVSASCSSCNLGLEYSIDGAEYQSGTAFTGLAGGVYKITVREIEGGQCVAERTVAVRTDDHYPIPVESSSSGWRQAAKLLAADGTGDDRFGSSVAMSGDYALVGASGNRFSDDEDSRAGVYVFRMVNGDWKEEDKLVAGDLKTGDNFAIDIAIDGRYAVVGASSASPDSIHMAGAAYVFHLENGVWKQQVKLTASDKYRNDYFGSQVDISGDRVVISAPAHDKFGRREGRVYTFQRKGDQWFEKQIITARSDLNSDCFGCDVALSGDRMVIGSPDDDQQGVEAGAAFIYEYSNNTWQEQAQLLPSAGGANYQFGRVVAIEGEMIAVGARENYPVPDGSRPGAVYVFRHISGVWQEDAIIVPSDPDYRDKFPTRISLSEEQMVVGAYQRTVTSEYGYPIGNAGAAYVFTLHEGGYEQAARLEAQDAKPDMQFGIGVALDQGRIIVGASYDEEMGPRAGAAYFFQIGYELPPIDEYNCEESFTVNPPLAQDNCRGTVVGTTTDAITFDSAGIFDIQWSFYDGNGNKTLATQQVTLRGDRTPPTVPGVEQSGWRNTYTVLSEEVEEGVSLENHLAISGKLAAVSGSLEAEDGSGRDNYVFLFEQEGTGGSWKQIARVNTGGSDGGNVSSLAISGDVLVVGTSLYDRPETNAGAVLVYERQARNIFKFIDRLGAQDANSYSVFGNSVSTDGRRIVVGAKDANAAETGRAGAAYVFERSTPQAPWAQTAKLMADEPQSGGDFGWEVALDASTIAISDPKADVAGVRDAGAVYTYTLNGEGQWEQTSLLTADTIQTYAEFGSNIQLSNGQIAVSAPSEDAEGYTDVGAVYIFTKEDTATGWVQDIKLQSARGNQGRRFGRHLSAVEGRVLVGTTMEGKNYLFKRDESKSWEVTDTIRFVSEIGDQQAIGGVVMTGNNIIMRTTDLTAGEVVSNALRFYDPQLSFPEATLDDCLGGAVSRPVAAVDACGGTVIATTESALIFTEAGEHTIEWVYDDGYGNTTVVTQKATVRGDRTPPAPADLTVDGWEQAALLLADDRTSQAGFGTTVTIDGHYAAVGAPGDNGSTGAVYIFERTALGAPWQQVAKLTAPNGRSLDRFGSSLALSGDLLLVGAPGGTGRVTGSGTAYTFERNESGVWLYSEKLVTIYGARDDKYGISVALDGNYAVVGSSSTYAGRQGSGQALIFERSGSGAPFERVEILYNKDGAAWDYFSQSLSMHDDLLVVGAWGKDVDGVSNVGEAYVYERRGPGSWTLSDTIRSPLPEQSAWFGKSVSLSAGRIAVGANRMDAEVSTQAGGVYLFEQRSPTGGWQQTSIVQPDNLTDYDRFGEIIDLKQDRLSVHLRREGEVILFERNPANEWLPSDTLAVAEGTNNSNFGTAIAMSGADILVGSMSYQDSGTGVTGAAYFYQQAYTLPALSLPLCNNTVAPAPSAEDDCSGTVSGTTPDVTRFTAPGEYTVDWTFADASGKSITATQPVTVYMPVADLPLLETAELASPTRDCWLTTSTRGETHWEAQPTQLAAPDGTDAFYLVTSAGGHEDRISSPAFVATTGTTYALSFMNRADVASTDLDLRVILVDAETQTEVSQLAHTKTIGTNYEHGRLRFTVPNEGNYRIAFVTDNVMDGGLLLDNILLTEFIVPADSNPLAGLADDNCTTLDGYGLDGDAWTRFQDPTGLLSIEINSNGNDLGDVRVEMTDYGATPMAPFLGEELLSRYWNIIPENGSGPYTENGGVRVRLYFTAEELSDFNRLRGKNRKWSDMVVTHYDGVNEDCSLLNSTDLAFETEIPTATGAFGGTAQYIEFTTTSFSEFGATSAAAAPVALTALTAREHGAANLIEWTVASEIDFSHYVVERSTDGISFHELGQVVGTNRDRYFLTDAAPAAQQYYRLRMVDLDGSYAYSKIVSVERENTNAFALQAHPVPTGGEVTLRFTAPTAGRLELRVTDALGRVVRHATIDARAGGNEQPLDLSGLPAAPYQLSVMEGGRIHTLRIIKQ